MKIFLLSILLHGVIFFPGVVATDKIPKGLAYKAGVNVDVPVGKDMNTNWFNGWFDFKNCQCCIKNADPVKVKAVDNEFTLKLVETIAKNNGNTAPSNTYNYYTNTGNVDQSQDRNAQTVIQDNILNQQQDRNEQPVIQNTGNANQSQDRNAQPVIQNTGNTDQSQNRNTQPLVQNNILNQQQDRNDQSVRQTPNSENDLKKEENALIKEENDLIKKENDLIKEQNRLLNLQLKEASKKTVVDEDVYKASKMVVDKIVDTPLKTEFWGMKMNPQDRISLKNFNAILIPFKEEENLKVNNGENFVFMVDEEPFDCYPEGRFCLNSNEDSVRLIKKIDEFGYVKQYYDTFEMYEDYVQEKIRIGSEFEYTYITKYKKLKFKINPSKMEQEDMDGFIEPIYGFFWT